MDLLAADTHAPATAQLREGHDFSNQEQLRRLQPPADISPPPRRIAGTAAEARAAQLAAAVLDELRMFEYTGLLPGGRSWSDQPAWRVELWRAYWEAKTTAEDWPELEHPDCYYD